MLSKKFPFVIDGEEAFPLKEYLVKPYARASNGEKELVANDRLSRARRIFENVFGICDACFRIFRRPIVASVETVVTVTKAVVGLHNYLMAGRTFYNNNNYCPSGFAEGNRRQEGTQTAGLKCLGSAASHNYTYNAKKIRDDLGDYFNGPSTVPWQWEVV